jgi:hypothetical protein
MTAPKGLLVLAAVLVAVDAGLRDWRPLRERAGHNLLYLALAWVPFFALPHLPPVGALVAAAVVALLSMVDFSRMVGLSRHPRFFVPALAMVAGSFFLAAVDFERAFSALPVLALLVIVAAGVASRTAEAFLQKLCLAWISVLVYGYLYAHAAPIAVAPRIGLSGPELIALIIFLAKGADLAWVASRRLFEADWLQVFTSPAGGVLAAAAASAIAPQLPARPLAVLGFAAGVGLGFGSRAYDLIVADVTGQGRRQLKGTMLFGFGLALAVGYWVMAILPGFAP